MSYNLFLDDERLPHRVTWANIPAGPWVVVKNYNEFVQYIEKYGMPLFVSFDHDLATDGSGKESTGYDCAKWLIEKCLNENLPFPDYMVHSMNPIGRENILGIIESFNRSFKHK